jgi:hypothetical protein
VLDCFHRLLTFLSGTGVTFLDVEIERICRSGALGRSPIYERLLRYLNRTTVSGTLPKEADIAVEVFGRSEFDPSTDSSVRVYLHHLRQKLKAYYDGQAADSPRFIHIPKGEYRLLVETRPIAGSGGAVKRSQLLKPWRVAATSIAVVLAAALFGSNWLGTSNALDATADTGLWRAMERDGRPLVVVLGDYYIFGEVGEHGNVERLIRDFRINSREELELGDGQAATDGIAYKDIGLSYLPVGTGVALAEISGVLRSIDREMIVIPQSSLDAKSVQSSDILYIGYLSGLGLLKEFVFAASNFELGDTYDELVDRDSGRLYVSEAGFPDGAVQDYVDYGFLSTFPGPDGNRVLIVAGMRDEGLMQMASILASATAIEELMTAAGETDQPPAMEALYRVRGMNRMNIAAERVFSGYLDPRRIWMDRPEVRSAALSDEGSRRTD